MSEAPTLPPLRDRVTAPATLDVPASSEGITWRASTIDDLDALLDCARACALVDHPWFMPTRDEYEEDFTVSNIDPRRDTIHAEDASGQIVARGIALRTATAETIVRVITDSGVRPSHRGRGLGTALRTWLDGRALQHLAAADERLPGWVLAYVPEAHTVKRELLERRGYRAARYFLELTRDLSAPIEPREPRGDLEIATYTPELSEATRLASNDAFRDHWGSQPQNEEVWRKHRETEVARDDLSFVALGTNAAGEREVAGYVFTIVNPDDWPGLGFSSAYVELVGTRREWRGRGIAPTLLTRVLEAAKAEGLEKVALDVDAENPTGAFDLYTALGFERSHPTIAYVREF